VVDALSALATRGVDRVVVPILGAANDQLERLSLVRSALQR
jgi:hypothetical protein